MATTFRKNSSIYETEFRKTEIKNKQPHKATCATCGKLQMLIGNTSGEAVEELKVALESYQLEANKAYELKKNDNILANQDNSHLLLHLHI